ncbi:MAG: hypothetical protein E4H01_05975 [Lysobacterales bacterium]|nr:MAG: hypothetical protein E4H01_05975 [Xanthomonadales bacterium]
MNAPGEFAEKCQTIANRKRIARQYLHDMREVLMSAPRRGLHPDNPEGVVTITLSHTLVVEWAEALKRAEVWL